MKKNMLLCAILAVSSQIVTAHSELTNIADQPTRVKKQTVSLLLQGLAQSCSHLGNVVGAQTQQEKQQGVLNVFGTVLATAAALTAPSQPQQQQQAAPAPQAQNEAVTKSVTDLTYALLAELDKEPRRSTSNLPELVAMVKNAATEEERETVLQKIFSSAVLAKQYIQELLTVTYEYLSEKTYFIINFIKEKLSESSSASYEETGLFE